MANKRRMISSAITESDAFTKLSLRAQALYFHLNIEGADDDGIVGAPLRIMRSIGANRKDLRDLVEGGFLLEFESGRVAVKHWMINNSIRRDRYTPSTFSEERDLLKVKPENRAYTLNGDGITLGRFLLEERWGTK